MFQWAKSRPFFRCAHVRAGVILHRRPWFGACIQSFVGPFASKASRHDAIPLKLCASKVSRNHVNDASVFESKVRRQSTPDISGDAKFSVDNAGRQDVDANFCTTDVKALAWSHHDAKSHFVDGDAKVSGFAACMPHANTQLNNDDINLASSSKFTDKWLPGDIFNDSCKTKSQHVSLQTVFKQTAQKVSANLQQKIEILESEQFSLPDVKRLLPTKAFKSCSVEQLATTLQELKKSFPCTKVVHAIVARSSNVLLQPAELVQQKLQLLQDFQVEEKVVSKLCSRGGALCVRMESLQKRLMFYDDIGLTVAAKNVMFWKAPLILTLTIENSIQPPLKFLESTGLTKESILKIAERYPCIFYMSLDKLMLKYEYIRQLGFSLSRFPKAFCFADRSSIKNMEKHLHTMRVLGFTDDDVKFMMQRQPAMLGLSFENIKCKVDFLISEQHRNLAEIVQFPTCLMYSLQCRIIPRFNVVNKLGHSKVYPLSSILSPNNSTFIHRFVSKNGSCVQLETCSVKP